MRVWLAFLGAVAACTSPAPDPAPEFQRVSEQPLAHGRRLATVLGCAGCHAPDLTGRDWSDELGTLWTSNLTRTAAAMSDAELAQTIVSGRRAGGRELWEMPSYLFTRLSADEMAAIIAFIRSKPVKGEIHPPPTFGDELASKIKAGLHGSSAAEVARTGASEAPDAGEGHVMARHIARATCAECHGVDLRGRSDPFGRGATPDIRIMAASYDLADFDRLLSTGVAAGGRELGLMSEVSRNRYSHFTLGERRALHAYLKALGDKALHEGSAAGSGQGPG